MLAHLLIHTQKTVECSHKNLQILLDFHLLRCLFDFGLPVREVHGILLVEDRVSSGDERNDGQTGVGQNRGRDDHP